VSTRVAEHTRLPLAAVLEELDRDGTAAQLRAVAATLTPEEHDRLAAEAAEGDRLAQLVVAVLASIPRTEALVRMPVACLPLARRAPQLERQGNWVR
jgi:hypothetical protein